MLSKRESGRNCLSLFCCLLCLCSLLRFLSVLFLGTRGGHFWSFFRSLFCLVHRWEMPMHSLSSSSIPSFFASLGLVNFLASVGFLIDSSFRNELFLESFLSLSGRTFFLLLLFLGLFLGFDSFPKPGDGYKLLVVAFCLFYSPSLLSGVATS